MPNGRLVQLSWLDGRLSTTTERQRYWLPSSSIRTRGQMSGLAQSHRWLRCSHYLSLRGVSKLLRSGAHALSKGSVVLSRARIEINRLYGRSPIRDRRKRSLMSKFGLATVRGRSSNTRSDRAERACINVTFALLFNGNKMRHLGVIISCHHRRFY